MNSIKPFPIRLPPELRDYLENKAEDNKRSLNNELIDRLEVTKIIESVTLSEPREIINEILRLDRYKQELDCLKQLHNELKDSYDSLKGELAKAFSLSGNTNEDIVRMKMERALNHITSGVNELRTIFPQNK